MNQSHPVPTSLMDTKKLVNVHKKQYAVCLPLQSPRIPSAALSRWVLNLSLCNSHGVIKQWHVQTKVMWPARPLGNLDARRCDHPFGMKPLRVRRATEMKQQKNKCKTQHENCQALLGPKSNDQFCKYITADRS